MKTIVSVTAAVLFSALSAFAQSVQVFVAAGIPSAPFTVTTTDQVVVAQPTQVVVSQPTSQVTVTRYYIQQPEPVVQYVSAPPVQYVPVTAAPVVAEEPVYVTRPVCVAPAPPQVIIPYPDVYPILSFTYNGRWPGCGWYRPVRYARWNCR